MMTDLATCRSCGSPILWVRSAVNDRPMPLDREPVEDGNVVLHKGAAHVFRDAATARVAFAAQHPPPDRYRSHHSTCPVASAHRRRGRTA